MIRTDNKVENPTVFRPPSHWDTPESKTKSSSKSSPEIISVKDKETITWSNPKNLPEGKDHCPIALEILCSDCNFKN